MSLASRQATMQTEYRLSCLAILRKVSCKMAIFEARLRP